MKWKRPKGKTRLTGLGDLVAVVAQPIARTLDAVVGTDIQHCGGCQKRREELNKRIPFNPDTKL